MKGFRFVPPARLAAILGAVMGLVTGTAAMAAAGLTGESSPDARAEIEVAHLPPLLTLAGEDVTLSYEAFCVSDTLGSHDDCEVDGTVFVRPGASRSGSFAPIPLDVVSSPEGRRLVARVPETVASSVDGFEYYAELRSRADGTSVTVPAGGVAAPHRSLRLATPVVVDLGTHVFGRTRRAEERVAATSWGSRPNEAGLEEGRNLSPIGASAFEVDRTGSVYVLDQAKRRILRWDEGATSPVSVPVSVSGSLADMAVASDGSLYVLETVSGSGGAPIVRRFDADGRELERVETAERTASQVRMGAGEPVVLQQPSHQWMPITSAGAIADARTQSENGRLARPLPGGGEILVLRTGNEIRIALTGRHGDRRAWRLTSTTPLGEIQLAQPLGRHLVVVTRAYTDAQAEFDVLILDGRGLVRRFSVSTAEWAEAAPLGRFKLARSALFRLGSNERGPFVERFDLEVRR